MTNRHACVWIDHREAKIFTISVDDVDEIVIHDSRSPLHIHRRADHVHLGKQPPDGAFLEEVAGHLSAARGIIIIGPGTARTELASYLGDNHPQMAKRVWGIEAADHPTDAQLIASARKYFTAARRMHAG
jgi:stalled ribosome rescue protein Dom34